MSSLLNEAKDLIEMSLNTDGRDEDYNRQARLWLEKAKSTIDAPACHEHGEGTACASCGFDLSCPACGH